MSDYWLASRSSYRIHPNGIAGGKQSLTLISLEAPAPGRFLRQLDHRLGVSFERCRVQVANADGPIERRSKQREVPIRGQDAADMMATRPPIVVLIVTSADFRLAARKRSTAAVLTSMANHSPNARDSVAVHSFAFRPSHNGSISQRPARTLKASCRCRGAGAAHTVTPTATSIAAQTVTRAERLRG